MGSWGSNPGLRVNSHRARRGSPRVLHLRLNLPLALLRREPWRGLVILPLAAQESSAPANLLAERQNVSGIRSLLAIPAAIPGRLNITVASSPGSSTLPAPPQPGPHI